MKIALLGANGRTGREVLSRALTAGHSVTALVRTEDRLADTSHSRLIVHVGNVCDPSVLKQILPGHDVVISTLGPRMPTKAACTIYSESATSIVEAMRDCAVKRLLVTSTALLFPSDKLLDRILGLIARHNVHNADLMEKTVRASNLQWTIARLGFLNEKSSLEFRLAEGALPHGAGSLSPAAVARFLLTEAEQPNYLNTVVGLGG
jgi:putative NADH-flavin reductase